VIKTEVVLAGKLIRPYIQIETDNNGVEILTAEEAVSFATKLINLAYPLTRATRKRNKR
jgi:hypothetical protein